MARYKRAEYEYLLMAGLGEKESRALIKKFRSIDEVNAKLRNQLSLPLTVLSELSKGKDVSKRYVRMALKSIQKTVELLNEQNALFASQGF